LKPSFFAAAERRTHEGDAVFDHAVFDHAESARRAPPPPKAALFEDVPIVVAEEGRRCRRGAAMGFVLADYVLNRLPRDYLLTPRDQEGLALCSLYLQDDPSHSNLVDAVRRACEDHGIKHHIDPFELLLDAGICDTELHPLPA